MFRLLGNLTSRTNVAIALVAAWIVVLLAVGHFAPDWDKVTVDGEVEFLPADSPSVKADAAFKAAFPLQYSSSNIAIVLSRTDHDLTDADREFVRTKLIKRACRRSRPTSWSARIPGPSSTRSTPSTNGEPGLRFSPATTRRRCSSSSS